MPTCISLPLFINAAIRYYFKGKELDILTKNPSINNIDGNVCVLYKICNNIGFCVNLGGTAGIVSHLHI